MGPVRRGPLVGLAGQAALLVLLALTVGLSGLGWAVGLLMGVATALVLSLAMDRTGTAALGPADRVTLVRTVLTGGVAALVADAVSRPPAVGVLVTLAVVGLVLDGVDGRIARRTGTASVFGARFDVEADALLLLVLGLHVARDVGLWVLLIPGLRYLYVLAWRALSWLRAPLPPRSWRKVVGTAAPVSLLLGTSGLLPAAATVAVLAVALLLLVESFGRDVLWLYRRRPLRGTAPPSS